MALLETHCFSQTLGMSISFMAIIPQQTGNNQIGMKGSERPGPFPTLYLLHGLSDDHTIWCRRTSIERYVSERGLAVIMPNVHRSFYTNMKYGERYFDFVADELPQLARGFFHLSEQRKDNHVAGLSMGGYGAFKIGMRRPDTFSSAASLSGVLDIANIERWYKNGNGKDHIFGSPEEVRGTEDDLFHLIEHPGKIRPKLFQICGTEDFLYQDNEKFLEAVQSSDWEHSYYEESGGHSWDFWDRNILRVLDWIEEN